MPTVDFGGVEDFGVPVPGNTNQITVTIPTGASTGTIRVTGTGGTDESAGTLTVFTDSDSLFSLSTPFLDGFSSTEGKAGAAKTYTIYGSNLSGNLILTASAPFEVSLNSDGPFASSLEIPVSGGSPSGYPVWVRVGTAGVEGPVSGSIAHSGGSAPSQTLAVSGTVASGAPRLTLSTATLGGLFASQGKPGTGKAYFVSGVNLSNPVTVSIGTSTNFQVSADNASFTNNLTLGPVNEGLSNVPVYVRISSNAPTGSLSGAITHTGTGLPGTNVSVLGTVTAKQYLAAWDFFGESNQPSSSADIFDALLDSGRDLIRGSDVNPSNGGNSFRSLGFKNNGISTTNNDYFQFSLSVTNGKTLTITSVVARFVGTTTFFAAPGVTNQFAYSTNDSSFILMEPPVLVTSTNVPITFDFSGVSELRNISSGTTVTLRFYASGQTTTGGWGFGSSAAGNYGLAVEGTIVSLPPVITSATNASGVARTPFSYTIMADNNPTFFSANRLPDGFSLDASLGVITGQPQGAGVYNVQLTAGNDGGDCAANLVLTIVDPILQLSTNSLTGLSSLVGSAGSSRTYTLSGSDLTGPISLGASAGFEISADNQNFASSLSLSPVGGTLAAKTISVRMSALATNGSNLGTLTHSGGGAVEQVINLSGTAFQPAIELSTNSLTGFSSISGTASGIRTYTVWGSYLAEAVSILLPVNSRFEVSADGASFSDSLMLLPVGGSLPTQTIQVRLKASAPEGSYTETITHSGAGAGLQNLALVGTVAKPPATLSLSSASVTGLTSVVGSPGTSQSYLVSGSGLTNVIRVTPSSGFEVSADGTGFGTNLAISPVSGVVSNYPVHVRLASNLPVGVATGSITHASMGAVPVPLAVTGTASASARPVITSSLFGAVYTNSSFSHTITATNPSGTNPISYGASNLPAGWSVNTNSGVISGPSSGAVSTNLTFTIWAANSQGTNSATYRLKVLTQADQTAIPLNVVVNKYLDSSAGDRIELLVTGDSAGDPPVDLRGMILKDFSSNMGADNGGKYLFNDVPLWASVKAGTLLILSMGSQYPEDLDGSDFKISVNLGNTAYFRSLGGTFNIGSTDMVMIKGAETGPDGVAGGIHALSGGNSGSQYTAFKGKKMNTGNSKNRPIVYAKNSASLLSDFDNPSDAAVGSAATFGAGNTAGNSSFITGLQGLDQQGPTISLLGSNPMTVPLGGSYSEPGANAVDGRDGNRTVQTSGSVNSSVLGVYGITYTASDSKGNMSTAVRTVRVVDQTPPMLTLNGSPSMQIPAGQSFTDPGAYATDNWDGPVPYTVSGEVNTASAGTYVLVYSALDTSGNSASEQIRTVEVSSSPQTWAAEFGLAGTNAESGADPDQDGLVNLAEYALGGNPTNASSQLLPVISAANTNGTNWMRFAYRARTNDGALVIQPVFKNSLTETNWATNGVVQKVSGQPAGDGVHENQVWQTPINADARKFLKLNISR